MGDKVYIEIDREKIVTDPRQRGMATVVTKTLVNHNEKYPKPHQGAKEKARRIKQCSE